MVWCLLVVGCTQPACEKPPEEPATPAPEAAEDPLLRAHAHNDYAHPRPLLDALDAGFSSVEVDVWLRDDRVWVSHDSTGGAGWLDELYLDPLDDLIAEGGSVHGDGAPFTLWIDLKQGSSALREALHELLGSHDWLTRIEGSTVSTGPVTAVLTGNATSKSIYVEDFDPRFAFRDSNFYAEDDGPADERWRYYALNWNLYVAWPGTGEPPLDVRERLRSIVARAHELERRVRFFSTPDTEAVWQLQLEEGVDFINTDDLQGLADFLDGTR
jgi:hypothetical protein